MTASITKQNVAAVVSSLGRKELIPNLRSSVYIWLGAALEDFMTQFTTELINEVNGKGMTVAQLRLNLFALAQHDSLDSLQSIRGLKMWRSRSELFALVDSSDVLALNPSVHPTNRRTIRPVRFETMWSVFGFTGPSLPSPVHGLALTELAGNRNKLAHGPEGPIAFGKLKTCSDLLNLIDRIEDVAQHLTLAGQTYLASAPYLR